MKEETPFYIQMAMRCVDLDHTKSSFGYCFGTLAEDTKVYKKTYYKSKSGNILKKYITTLVLETGTRIGFTKNGGLFFSKCRAGRAFVLNTETIKNSKKVKVTVSGYNSCFKYVVGEYVEARLSKRREECASGIHFFFTRREAERW